MEELADDVFSNTPLWTPSLRNSRRSTFFQSPKFQDLLHDNRRQSLPQLAARRNSAVLQSPALGKVNLGRRNSPVLANLVRRNSSLLILNATTNSPHLVNLTKGTPELVPSSVKSAAARATPVLGLLARRCSPNPVRYSGKKYVSSSGKDPRQIQLTKLLGSGGFGSVYMGLIHGQNIAVKKFHACKKNVKARLQSFKAESNILHLSHPNVVSVLASYCEGQYDDSYIIMEYAGHLNLQKLINDSGGPLLLHKRLRYARDVAKALDYIHNRCVVHLDVKPSNVIISPQDVCRLADFGCCQMVEGDTGQVSPTLRSYLTGTVAYRAPELLRGEPPSRKADIYSFGITMWQMLTGECPFAGENPHVIIFGVVAQNMRPKPPALSNPGESLELLYQELYCKCWAAGQPMRPAADHLVEVLDTWLKLLTPTQQ